MLSGERDREANSFAVEASSKVTSVIAIVADAPRAAPLAGALAVSEDRVVTGPTVMIQLISTSSVRPESQARNIAVAEAIRAPRTAER